MDRSANISRMMLRRFSLAVFASAVLTLGATAAGWSKPNHLRPVMKAGGDLDSYELGVRCLLFGADAGMEKEAVVLWMICQPSFRSESALWLRRERRDGAADLWRLELARMDKPIWNLEEEDPDAPLPRRMTFVTPPSLQVARRHIEIRATLAAELQRAWRAVLEQTRPVTERERTALVDGVPMVFYALHGARRQFGCDGDRLAGETDGLEIGPPVGLCLLANQLVKAVEIGDGNWRRELLDDCFTKAKQLQGEVAATDPTREPEIEQETSADVYVSEFNGVVEPASDHRSWLQVMVSKGNHLSLNHTVLSRRGTTRRNYGLENGKLNRVIESSDWWQTGNGGEQLPPEPTDEKRIEYEWKKMAKSRTGTRRWKEFRRSAAKLAAYFEAHRHEFTQPPQLNPRALMPQATEDSPAEPGE